MADPELPSLAELQKKIDEAKAPLTEHSEASSNGDMSLAMRFSVELLAGVAVGTAIGYMLDRWLGTLPLFLIVCLFMGMAAGMLNVIRSGRMIDQKVENEENKTTGPT